jgi:tetratricopeptide (TPR) repeat protein
MTNYPLALEYTLKGLRISEEGKDTESLLSGYKTLANIYTALDDYDKAVDYSRRSLKIDEEMGNQRLKQQDLNNLALSFESVEDYQQAIKYRKESLEIAEEMGFEMEVMNMLVALAFDHAKISDFSNALDYCLKSQKLNEKFGDTVTMGSRLINLGYVISNAPPVLLVNKGFDSSLRYTQSVQYLLAGLKIAKEKGKLDLQRKAWEYIHPIYKNQKNFPKALEAYENLVILRDSILNNRKKKEFMRMDIQYTYDKKEDSLKLQQQVLDEKLKRQLLLSQQQEQQLELNKKELVLSGKEKELQKLAYLKTEADLQNEQLEKKGKEKQLTIAEKEKQLQLAKVKSLTNENNLNAIKQQQQRLYIFGGFILLGCTGFYFFNRTRLQQERLKTQLASERTEQQHKEAEFQRSLADVSLTALRSQMNPHFIFNCLNSIKLYTTQNNTVAASEYLTKFSRLIRLVLENSRKDTITLASELDALRLYMEMEEMRFKEKLTFNISVERDVDLDFIEIPPLLLQPYAENAIWHGLMHKEAGGRIDIEVSTAENGTMLRINIADNGIGRAKSAELMSKSATKHKSYGMKVTSERLALINSVYKTGANVTIHDLFNVDGQASGTRVIIQIPLK